MRNKRKLGQGWPIGFLMAWLKCGKYLTRRAHKSLGGKKGRRDKRVGYKAGKKARRHSEREEGSKLQAEPALERLVAEGEVPEPKKIPFSHY